MSGLLAPPGPPQGNVLPFPPQPQQMVPNPAFQQWAQEAQKVQAIMAENAKRQQQFDAAVALIKKDGITGFRLDIEADSTIAPDEQAEKAARIEFMQQFVPLMAQIIPMARGNPAIAKLAKEAVLFAVRGFRVARQLEESIEQAFDGIAQMPPDPSTTGDGKTGSHQNPQIEQAKVQADVHDTETKAKVDMAAVIQKATQAAQDAQVRMAQVQAENDRSRAEQITQAAELAQRERLESARIQHMAARDAQGVV